MCCLMAATFETWRSKCGSKYPKADIDRWDKQLKADLAALRRLPHNRKCFDCGTDDTTWASPKLGIFICVACSDVHRAAGAHITSVKNFNTYLWGPDEVEVMKAVGNREAASRYGNGMVCQSDSKNSKVANCTQKYGGAQTQRLIQNQVEEAKARETGTKDQIPRLVPETITNARTSGNLGNNGDLGASSMYTDDWFDNMFIVEHPAAALDCPPVVKQEYHTSFPEKSAPHVTVDDWFDLLSCTETASVEALRDLKPGAEEDELEFFLNSLGTSNKCKK